MGRAAAAGFAVPMLAAGMRERRESFWLPPMPRRSSLLPSPTCSAPLSRFWLGGGVGDASASGEHPSVLPARFRTLSRAGPEPIGGPRRLKTGRRCAGRPIEPSGRAEARDLTERRLAQARASAHGAARFSSTEIAADQGASIGSTTPRAPCSRLGHRSLTRWPAGANAETVTCFNEGRRCTINWSRCGRTAQNFAASRNPP